MRAAASRALMAVTIAVVFAPLASAREQIVGGDVAAAGSWPSLVALVDPNAPDAFTGQFCAGTLLAPSWVVTAASCTFDDQGATLTLDRISVLAGVTDLTQAASGQQRGVSAIVYPDLTVPASTDVALLQLATPIDAQASPPIAMASIVSPFADDLWSEKRSVQVAGWGSTTADEPLEFPTVLREATVTRVGDDTCLSQFVTGVFSVASDLCLSRTAPGPDPCVGDEGGPLVATDANRQKFLVGLVNFPSFPCGTRPTVATRLGADPIRNWIIRRVFGSRTSGPVTGATATAGVRSIAVTWTPPTDSGSDPILGYVVRVQQPSGFGGAIRLVKSVAFSPGNGGSVTDLVPNSYTLSIHPVTRAGAGPGASVFSRALSVPPVFSVVPTIVGRPRVGTRISGSVGSWLFPDRDGPPFVKASSEFEACSVTTGECRRRAIIENPGIVGPTLIGMRLRFRVLVESFDGRPDTVGYSALSEVVPPTLRVRAPFTSPRARSQSTVLRGGIQTQKGTKVVVQVLDERGRRLRLDRDRSVIGGRVPQLLPGGRKLRATLRGSTAALTIRLAEKRNGPLKKGTLIVLGSINGSVDTQLRIPIKIPS